VLERLVFVGLISGSMVPKNTKRLALIPRQLDGSGTVTLHHYISKFEQNSNTFLFSSIAIGGRALGVNPDLYR
jgi:hypothetical protein